MTARSIRTTDLAKSFGEETALQNINLTVDSGKIFVVLGPSGCGKSTLLKCIAGLVEPSQGSIYFDGEEVTTQRPAERDLGFVFQEFEDTLFAHMTVRENIRAGLQQDDTLQSGEIEQRIDDILDLVAISEEADAYPENLSGGQQQRVELARQVVRECDLMLLDDPLADLDYKLQKRMELELRKKHAASGDTYLYVTHNQTQALELADKLVVMNAGRIEQVGTPEEVYHNPKTAFVGRFVGDSNMIIGELDESGRNITTDSGTVDLPSEKSIDSEQAVVLIRPTDITLDPDPESVYNAFAGTIQGQTFLGEDTEFIVSVPEIENQVLVRLPGQVTTEADEVSIGWDTSAAMVYGLDELSVDPSVTLADLKELYS